MKLISRYVAHSSVMGRLKIASGMASDKRLVK